MRLPAFGSEEEEEEGKTREKLLFLFGVVDVAGTKDISAIRYALPPCSIHPCFDVGGARLLRAGVGFPFPLFPSDALPCNRILEEKVSAVRPPKN